MNLLFRKYLPKNLDEIKYHDNIKKILQGLDIRTIPHLIFYGSRGSGKKSLLYAFLGYYKKKSVIRTIKTTKEIKFTMYKNSVYIEFDVKEMGMYDKFIIINMIKELAKTKHVCHNTIRIIVLHHAECLSLQAQYILRKIMEIYVTNCRFILVCNQINKLVRVLKSRCVCLRIKCPTSEDIDIFVKKIIKEEKIDMGDMDIDSLINGDRNMKNVIFKLDLFKYHKLCRTDIDQKLNIILNLMMLWTITQEVLVSITSNIHQFVMDNNIELNTIIIILFDKIIDVTTCPNKHKNILSLAVDCEHKTINGAKQVIHVQNFIFGCIKILRD